MFWKKKVEKNVWEPFLNRDVNPNLMLEWVKSDSGKNLINQFENQRDELAKDLAYSACIDITKIAFRKGEIATLNNIVAKLKYIRNEEEITNARPVS